MPCDYRNYPLDWFTKIRPAALARARFSCLRCEAPNYALYYYAGLFFCTNASFAEAQKNRYESGISDSLKIVVLTVHHIDGFVMNNDPKNLRVMCLTCANRSNAKTRAAKRKLTKTKALETIAPSLPLYTNKFQPV